MEVSGELLVSAALPLGKGPCYLLNRRQDGPQSRSGRFVGRNLFPLPGFEPWIAHLVA
jgi:hypothetical protein